MKKDNTDSQKKDDKNASKSKAYMVSPFPGMNKEWTQEQIDALDEALKK